MSWTYGEPVERLYSYANPATQLASFNTEQNLQATYPPAQLLLPVLMKDVGATGRKLRISAAGQLGTTGSPTFTWTVRMLPQASGAVPAWSAGGILLTTTGAVTAAATVTLAMWYIEAHVTLRTLSTGAASTVETDGYVLSPAGLATPFAASLPASNTALTSTTVDNSQNYYLFMSANCGTSNALNLMNLQRLTVYAE